MNHCLLIGDSLRLVTTALHSRHPSIVSLASHNITTSAWDTAYLTLVPIPYSLSLRIVQTLTPWISPDDTFTSLALPVASTDPSMPRLIPILSHDYLAKQPSSLKPLLAAYKKPPRL